MQEIHEFQRENGVIKELRDRLVGHESPELIRQFTARRKALEERIESGVTDKATIREARRITFDDPCPCGSDSTFRACCGARLAESDERVNHNH